ncbi:hypothetical protein M2157_008886 [Streptomyces sp. SAI-127]|nr:hypothetical protein [Streptomyces sp. SAI-127]
MPKTASVSPRPALATDLMTSLGELLRQWLPRQRWFAGKDRPVSELGLLSMTELFPGCLHLLVHTDHGGVPGPGGATPAGDCYQLLLGVRKHLSPRLGRALIGRAEQGPLAGLTIYDALHDPRSAQLLLERLRHPGTAGPLRFEGDPSVPVPAGLPPRLLETEQSNSSLVYGDEFILKVFRRIQPGVNPDLEVPVALAGQGCRRVPAPVAWFRTTHPQGATLGVLQPYLRDASDGWALALQALASGDDFTVQAHELGRAMAEVHLALAAAFPGSGHDDNGSTAAAMTERLDAAAHSVPALRPFVPGPAERVRRAGHVRLRAARTARPRRPASGAGAAGGPRVVRDRLRGRAVPPARRAVRRPVPGAGHRGHAALLRLRGPAAPALAAGVGAPLPGGLLRGLCRPRRVGSAQETRPAARL